MDRNRLLLLMVILIAASLVVIYYPSEKKRVKKVIHRCIESVLHEDVDHLMEPVSFNYRDDFGGSYAGLRKRAELIFNRFDDFDMTADIMNVTVEGKQAEAVLKVSIIASEGNERGYLVGDAGGNEDIKVFFEKSPYEWKVIKIERGMNR